MVRYVIAGCVALPDQVQQQAVPHWADLSARGFSLVPPEGTVPCWQGTHAASLEWQHDAAGALLVSTLGERLKQLMLTMWDAPDAGLGAVGVARNHEAVLHQDLCTAALL